MTCFKISIVSLLFLLPARILSQNNWSSPKEALSWLNSNIIEVKQADKVIKQNIVSDFQKGSKCEFLLSVETAGSVSETKNFEFYWEHINTENIETIIKGKELYILIKPNGDAKYIKEFKGGSTIYSLTNKLQLYFDDIQIARNGIDCLKYLKKETPPYQPSFANQTEAYQRLMNDIGRFTLGGYTINQNLQVITDQNNKFSFITEENDSKGNLTKRHYEFYMTDFSSKSVSVKTSGFKIIIELISHSDIKPVKYFINDVQQNYINKVEVISNDIQKAHIIKNTLIYLTGGKTEDVKTVEKKSFGETVFPHHYKNKNEVTDTTTIDYSGTDITKCPDIDFTNRPYFYLPDNTITTLERTDGTYEIKVKGGGYGGTEGYLTVFGKNSTSSFSKSSLPKIIIKVDSGTDPMDVINIVKAEISGDRRRFIISKNKLYGKASDISDAYVDFSVNKIKDQFYEIILNNKITQGEYIFMPISNPNTANGSTIKVSCFGIK